MKTEHGNYYIFFNSDDFWKKVQYWKLRGRVWIIEPHPDYNPQLRDKDFPCVLNVDSKSMMFGVIFNFNKDKYFSDPIFVKLYNKELRKLKLKNINTYE